MTGSTEQEITRLHEQVARVYHGRTVDTLTAQELLTVDGLWARIERLQSADVAAHVKEAKAREALIAAKAKEGME